MPHVVPRLRYHDENRHATWLELFFDLVFVVVVSKVTHILAYTHGHHLEPGVFWKFPLMLLPVWWIWLLHTIWANLYDTDGKQHRVASLLVMLQMIVLSTVMITDWEAAFPLFNACYFGLRLTLAILFMFLGKGHAGYERYGKERGTVILIAALVSLSSALFPAPLRYGVFYLGIAIDILHPLILRARKKSPPLHNEHLIERMGLLIIILMGESIISLSAGLVDMEWRVDTALAASCGAIMIGAAWWIYFDSYHHLGDENGRLKDGIALMYPHFFTCLGLSVIANVIYHAIHPGIDRLEYQVMAVAGVIAFYLGKQIPYFAKFPTLRKYIIWNSALTFAICAVAVLLPGNTAILLGLTCAMLVYVVANFLTTIRALRRMEIESNQGGAADGSALSEASQG